MSKLTRTPMYLTAAAFGVIAAQAPLHAATVTWTGTNYTWTQSDANSFDATYNSGDTVVFGNTGITDGTNQAIVLSGVLTPAAVTFNHTLGRYAGSSTNPGGATNYLLTSNGTANVITATGALTLGSGNAIFRALDTNGTYTHTFGGALNYSGGAMLGISSNSTARIMRVQVASLAAPTAGNSILFNAITLANGNSGGTVWSTTANRVLVTGSKPSVTNGMVSPGMQFYTGGNVLGEFMTFDGDALIPATANYTSYGGDWAAAAATEIVNVTTAATLTGSGGLNVHSLRLASSGTHNLGGRTINLGSGGFITTSATTSNGTLNFGSGPGFIGAYNASGQATITATIAGSGGITVLGTSQALNLNTANTFTGGLFVNGGNVALGHATAANGNDVTVNALGRLTASTSTTIGGLSGNGGVEARFQSTGTQTLTISPASGTYTFSGDMNNGDAGMILAITKAGNGKQILNATATYTGETIVNAGILQVDGTHTAAGNYTVNANGTLGGNGTITFANGKGASVLGTLAPGASVGALAFANGDVDIDGVFQVELSGLLADLLAVSGGNLTLDGTIDIVHLTSPSLTEYKIATASSITNNATITGQTDWVPELRASGTELWIVIPEPASLALFGLGSLLIVWRKRK